MATVKYTGPIASFHCPTNAEIRHLKVHFSPKQEGTGDPSPENVRPIVGWEGVKIKQSGKNLIDINLVKHGHPSVAYHSSDEPNDMIFANGELSGTVTEGWRDTTVFSQLEPFDPGTYTLSFDYENKAKNYSWRPICITSTYSGWYTAYKSIAAASSEHGHIISTFTADVPFYISMCLNSFGNAVVTAKNRIYNINLELGSTATSYEPYRGNTTNYEFGVLGKNKFPSADGTKSDVFMAKGITYTLSATSTSLGYFKGYYEDGTDTGVVWVNEGSDGDRSWKRYTPQEDIVSGFFFVSQGMSECQVELGSTATAYEPYDPKHTVYGGWVDLVSGEVCEEWIKAKVSSVIVGKNTYGSYWVFNSRPGVGVSEPGAVIAETYTGLDAMIPLSTIGNRMPDLSIAMRSIQGNIFIKDTRYEEYDDFISNMGETMLCYKLATPNTYSLASTQLQTFLGQNNVWSNADYVEVEYDLHETQTILQRKQYILANQPHIVTAQDKLVNFSTDLAAPLKSCKVNFEPKQEGTGDPSPDNVRAISGWTGIKLMHSGISLLPTDNNDDPNANYANTGTGRISYDAAEGCFVRGNGTGVAWAQHWFRLLGEQAPNNNTSCLIAAPYEMTVTLSFDYKHNGVSTVGNTWPIRITGAFINNIRAEEDPIEWTHYERTVTLQAGQYISMIFYNGIYWKNLRLFAGSTTQALDEYEGQVDELTLPSEIYGGYVDLVTGNVYNQFNCVDMGALSWHYTNGRFYAPISDALIGSDNNYLSSAVCDIYPTVTYNNIIRSGVRGIAINNVAYIRVCDDYSTIEDFTSVVNGHMLVYPLATPVLLTTLTPTQLKSLKGINNIWSDVNGNVEVSYWTH